jgi:hypothetical protein
LTSRSSGVAVADLELEPGRPLDPDLGVVVADAALGLGDVVPAAFVDHVRDVAGDDEAVREPDRDVELGQVLVAQLDGLPLGVGG